ncbi:MAG: hypothetical protein ACRBN8_19625 [Nannocystales bacterium]
MPFIYKNEDTSKSTKSNPCCDADAAVESGPCCDPKTGVTTVDSTKVCCKPAADVADDPSADANDAKPEAGGCC